MTAKTQFYSGLTYLQVQANQIKWVKSLGSEMGKKLPVKHLETCQQYVLLIWVGVDQCKPPNFLFGMEQRTQQKMNQIKT